MCVCWWFRVFAKHIIAPQRSVYFAFFRPVEHIDFTLKFPLESRVISTKRARKFEFFQLKTLTGESGPREWHSKTAYQKHHCCVTYTCLVIFVINPMPTARCEFLLDLIFRRVNFEVFEFQRDKNNLATVQSFNRKPSFVFEIGSNVKLLKKSSCARGQLFKENLDII